MYEGAADHSLFDQTLNELASFWQEKSPEIPQTIILESAKITLLRKIQLAVMFHEQYAPKPPRKVEISETLLEKLRSYSPRVQEATKRFRQLVNDSIYKSKLREHRAMLIEFFIVDNCMSRVTAEQIVDRHILQSQ